MKKLYLLGVLLPLIAACEDPVNPGYQQPDPSIMVKVVAPSDVQAVQVKNGAVQVSWKDNSENETGFFVVYKKEGATVPVNAGKTAANDTSFIVTGLKEGNTYTFGVSASSQIKYSLNSDYVYSTDPIKVIHADFGHVDFTGPFSSTYASVVAQFKVTDFESEVTEAGVCWDYTANPTRDANHLQAADPNSDNNLLVISNVLIEEANVDYHFRAYAVAGGNVYYSADSVARLMSQPDPITFTWNDITPAGFPTDVKVYQTESTLDGTPIRAWYAKANLLSGSVKLKADNTTTKTLDKHWTDDCLVMINGAYFYNTNAVGLAVINTSVECTLEAVRGTLRSSGAIYSEYQNMYNVTRGCFAVDATGYTKVLWNYKDKYYDAPLPNVVGYQQYKIPTVSWTEHQISYSPKFALGAGPVVLSKGKITCEFTEAPKGTEYYLNNPEVIPYDIFGKDVTPDRTCIGRDGSGNVYFFVCDGRLGSDKGKFESGGATLDELGRIMLGIGCTDACNMDGGGSTNMLVAGTRVNYEDENRPVATTWGIYRNK